MNSPLIDRHNYQNAVKASLEQFPITAILGPRQCGKTTLARQIAADSSIYFDLEDPLDLSRLENPRLVLEKLRGLVVIDEIQQKPELFPLLRVLVDSHGSSARYLILGSASPSIVKGISESLAGRVGFIDMTGFDAGEIGFDSFECLWLRGGFPMSFLARSDEESFRWRTQFIRTFLTQDMPQLGFSIPSEQMRRFWIMLAHYHGQTWNASEIAGSLNLNYKTTQRYLDILTGAFMIRQLQPWFENVGKRIRKTPKIYFRDSGIFHALLNLKSMDEIQTNPKLGASWEGVALEHVVQVLKAAADEIFYWNTYGGAELDLFIIRGGRRFGFEFKYADAPRTTKSMRIAFNDLRLEHLFMIYPGSVSYSLDPQIEVVPLEKIDKGLSGL